MTSYPTADNAFAWWLVTGRWKRLHAIPADNITEADMEDRIEHGGPLIRRALCGTEADWTMPGPLSRLGLPRCVRCCRFLRIPAGNGTPANEKETT